MVRTDIGDRFKKIYEHNLWASSESRSGTGSEIKYTAQVRNWLIQNVPKLQVTSLVDAPCGDFNWMRLVLPQISVDYLGLDIVEELIVSNHEQYASDTIAFGVADLCRDPIPPCDFIMVRDCLFHLSYADICRFLANLARTEFRYLFTTTHIVEPGFTNKDIVTGGFRRIDLFSYPFNFDPSRVEGRVDDFPQGFPVKREMILVRKEDVPVGLNE